jgi:predicted nucleotidyltransferase
MIDLGPNGHFECGRRRSTLSEVHSRFVEHPDFERSESRGRIWQSFDRATKMLEDVIPVRAIWIGGSFVTAKLDPSDIDVVYIVDARDYDQLNNEQARKRVGVFSTDGGLFSRSIPVDSHIMQWRPFPELRRDHLGHIPYLADRGYWDDFLQRFTADKLIDPTVSNAIPRKGYLEVIISDYTE